MVQIWIAQILPIKLIEVLPAISLIAIGLIVEKYYVGRISLFANAIALSTYFYRFSDLNIGLIWYINIISLLGILALVSYVTQISLPKQFYWFAGLGSSFISGILLLWGATL